MYEGLHDKRKMENGKLKTDRPNTTTNDKRQTTNGRNERRPNERNGNGHRHKKKTTKKRQRRTVRKTETVQYSTRTKVGNRAHRKRFHQEPEFRIPGWFQRANERKDERTKDDFQRIHEVQRIHEFTNARIQNAKRKTAKRQTQNIKTQNIKTQNVKMSKMPKCLKCQMPVEVRSEH